MIHKKIIPFFILICSLFGELIGEELVGSLTFDTRKPPMVGLLMFPEDKSLTNIDIVDQRDKSFTKLLYVAPPKSKMKFKNSDSISHNIFSKDSDLNVDFDFGLMATGSEFQQEVTWEYGAVVKLNCKIHPMMMSYIACLQTKYYHVVELKGQKEFAFSMKNIPKQYKKIRFWMPSYKTIEFELGSQKTYEFDLVRETSPDKVRGKLKLVHDK